MRYGVGAASLLVLGLALGAPLALVAVVEHPAGSVAVAAASFGGCR